MPGKRSRITGSSSFGDIGVLSPPVRRAARPSAAAATAKPTNSAKVMKPVIPEKSPESRTRILTVSSPVQERVGACDDESIAEFLDKCYHCKKRIGANDDVFMYSYFRAFCSVECRNIHITMDLELEKASGGSKIT